MYLVIIGLCYESWQKRMCFGSAEAARAWIWDTIEHNESIREEMDYILLEHLKAGQEPKNIGSWSI